MGCASVLSKKHSRGVVHSVQGRSAHLSAKLFPLAPAFLAFDCLVGTRYRCRF